MFHRDVIITPARPVHCRGLSNTTLLGVCVSPSFPAWLLPPAPRLFTFRVALSSAGTLRLPHEPLEGAAPVTPLHTPGPTLAPICLCPAPRCDRHLQDGPYHPPPNPTKQARSIHSPQTPAYTHERQTVSELSLPAPHFLSLSLPVPSCVLRKRRPSQLSIRLSNPVPRFTANTTVTGLFARQFHSLRHLSRSAPTLQAFP